MNEQQAMMNQAQQQQQPQLMSMSQNAMTMNQMNPQPQPQMVPMNRNYGMWAAPLPQFQNPNLSNPNPGSIKPLPPYHKSLGPRNNWKGKRMNKTNDNRRKDFTQNLITGSSGIPGGVGNMIGTVGGVGNMIGTGGSVGNVNFGNYQPPGLNDLQRQNRLKTRKIFPKKKFNNNNKNMGNNKTVGGANSYNYNNYYGNRSAPYAPRNTTSFLIRAKKSGGIASLVSPSPGTPAVLPTPIFSPSREALVDTAKEEWGVDGYGSMKGFIRLRSSPGHEDDEEDDGGSSESDVEEHLEVERRLDQDLSRFEMVFNPNSAGGMEYHNVLENRVDDQDTHIAQLEEENLILKERLFLMERELGDLRRRLQFLERRGNGMEEVLENDSENDTESHEEEVHSMEDNNEESSEDNMNGERSSKVKMPDALNTAEAYGEVEKNAILGHNASEVIKDEKDVEYANAEGRKDYSNEEFKAEEKPEATENSGENNCGDLSALTLAKSDDMESSDRVIMGRDHIEEAGIAIPNLEVDVDN